ncbi:hypothetical protein EX30DRAFT_227275 [Ascodesmis nigricans]|uniref:Uncharacterized protein n=1 Tax=Ascodesmis nigricans TaxID=341454 RepID=A0A4S2MJ35_9PEZI|nr:hypothetical protein EX30DRAFT_227275 [Ascodesmis nigricans]
MEEIKRRIKRGKKDMRSGGRRRRRGETGKEETETGTGKETEKEKRIETAKEQRREAIGRERRERRERERRPSDAEYSSHSYSSSKESRSHSSRMPPSSRHNPPYGGVDPALFTIPRSHTYESGYNVPHSEPRTIPRVSRHQTWGGGSATNNTYSPGFDPSSYTKTASFEPSPPAAPSSKGPDSFKTSPEMASADPNLRVRDGYQEQLIQEKSKIHNVRAKTGSSPSFPAYKIPIEETNGSFEPIPNMEYPKSRSRASYDSPPNREYVKPRSRGGSYEKPSGFEQTKRRSSGSYEPDSNVEHVKPRKKKPVEPVDPVIDEEQLAQEQLLSEHNMQRLEKERRDQEERQRVAQEAREEQERKRQWKQREKDESERLKRETEAKEKEKQRREIDERKKASEEKAKRSIEASKAKLNERLAPLNTPANTSVPPPPESVSAASTTSGMFLGFLGRLCKSNDAPAAPQQQLRRSKSDVGTPSLEKQLARQNREKTAKSQLKEAESVLESNEERYGKKTSHITDAEDLRYPIPTPPLEIRKSPIVVKKRSSNLKPTPTSRSQQENITQAKAVDSATETDPVPVPVSTEVPAPASPPLSTVSSASTVRNSEGSMPPPPPPYQSSAASVTSNATYTTEPDLDEYTECFVKVYVRKKDSALVSGPIGSNPIQPFFTPTATPSGSTTMGSPPHQLHTLPIRENIPPRNRRSSNTTTRSSTSSRYDDVPFPIDQVSPLAHFHPQQQQPMYAPSFTASTIDSIGGFFASSPRDADEESILSTPSSAPLGGTGVPEQYHGRRGLNHASPRIPADGFQGGKRRSAEVQGGWGMPPYGTGPTLARGQTWHH